MHELCPICGHQFIREQGYFQGAMYVSYAMGLGTLMLLTPLVMIPLPPNSEWLGLGIIVPIWVLVVPVIYRYSRVIWMHLFYRAF